MLIEFKVKNFKSIKDELYFSMEKGEGTRTTKNTKNNVIKLDKNTSLLKSALIFGANASGKSNFLEAIFTLNTVIVTETRTISDELEYNGYGDLGEPTVFEIIFIKNKIRYSYKLSYDNQKIYDEILKADENLIFDRKELQIEELRDNETLIFYYQRLNQKESTEVFRWFADDLLFNHGYFELPLNQLYKNLNIKGTKEKFLKILKYADFNIVDVKIVNLPYPTQILKYAENHFEDPFERERFLKRNVGNTLVLVHQNKEFGEFSLALNNESKGTQEAIKLILMILSFDSNKVLLFDEFDDAFHLNLSKTFLSLINSEMQKSQFILTTHETKLMDHKMRKDQIYFMEKDSNGVSSMFSMFDFTQSKTRNDASYSKKYILGRFGGLPYIDEEAILGVLEE